ncbi:hydantoinase B/oxoprolinase family protein [Kaustia mangrovi]|uniref:Hydantoinase B/oxoprolinase family protein n=1 Tax=Kaustia mangrovi TaxID=2593653 RepID=A0A7S8HCI3_9HYPH|nr:hydantoinase B/oxoprolinase family protein [Kaustia mangrovi]QPC43273.1 hydantoinase B/oxoprolinase family protein [Kaustia mangrovi]
MTDSPKLDPVTLEIIGNGLRSVTDESFIALMRSSFSTNIKERRDHSTAICDLDGRLIAQADQALPIHLASMIGLMKALLSRYDVASMEDGDIFVANDPHVAGGTHLPDINMAMPVFVDGEPIAFVCNIAHHADVGGTVPGSMAGGLSEIYQEGLRIPVLKLYRAGELQGDLLDLMLLNMRVPAERRGDLNAQIAACRLGRTRLLELVERFGREAVAGSFDEIVSRTEARMRSAVAALPDGEWRFEDVMDDDGLGTVDVAIRLRITKSGDGILFDFDGTDPQVKGNINTTLNAAQSAVCYAMKALLDPDAPNNQGVIDVLRVEVPEGTLVNCRPPAPVAARANTCQRIIDVVIGAMAEVLPDRVIGAANGANTTAVFAGVDPRTGEPYVYLETLGGGMGARNDRDGKDGVQVHITNTSNLPVEAIEMEYPLRVESYGFVEDSGGAGRWRGGMGLRRRIRPVGRDCVFNGAGERFRNRPWGVFGGQPGGSGRFVQETDGGEPVTLPIKPSGVALAPDQCIVVETPGAGGYGDPRERSAEARDEDRRSGKFSEAYMARHYGEAGSPEE